MSTEKIGFVGVGRMGANMARRLKESGYTIAAVFDVNAAAAQALAQELGGTAADDLKVVTALSDVVITVVSDDKAMKEIFTHGLLTRAKGKLFINCATITPAVHVWVEQKCEAKGAQSLEACMASSITQARGVCGNGGAVRRTADGWRGYAEPGALVLFLGGARGEGFGDCVEAGEGAGIEPAAGGSDEEAV